MNLNIYKSNETLSHTFEFQETFHAVPAIYTSQALLDRVPMRQKQMLVIPILRFPLASFLLDLNGQQ